jgi:U3 small nucleolar ribonucleoprotein protein IMP4
MLISTSRKPSQKTRKFCKNFAHATDSTSVNRGKMNMRELLLRALDEDEINLAIVNEIKGNPSRITFYSNKGEVLITVLISVTTTNERLNISPSKLKIVSEVQKLNCLSDILGFELVDKAEENYINITDGYDDLIAKINFINKFGDKTDFQINIKKILDYVVLGLCFLCLLSLLFPIIRFWRTLNDSIYAEYFVSGYAFIFGGEIKDVAKENSTNILEVKLNVRYLLAYIFTILSYIIYGYIIMS